MDKENPIKLWNSSGSGFGLRIDTGLALAAGLRSASALVDFDLVFCSQCSDFDLKSFQL